MTTSEFMQQLDARIAKYDLLSHPFYQAWSKGELTKEDLREYGQDYYHHVEAFPAYLAELAIRLNECELRRAVLANMCAENGKNYESGEDARPHAEMWQDFIEGMGGRVAFGHPPVTEIKELVQHFHRVANEGTPEEALAAFYAYESQVPRVAAEKARGLRELYRADEKTRGYFTLHATADVYHSQVWRKQLEKQVESEGDAEKALAAAEAAAKALWRALDGIEARRMDHVAA
jgi:pyrroloquinoline-quinone synthase